MWIFVFLLNFLGRKNFLRFVAGWAVIMLFFLYCFVHEAFDQPRTIQGAMIPHIQSQAAVSPPQSDSKR